MKKFGLRKTPSPVGLFSGGCLYFQFKGKFSLSVRTATQGMDGEGIHLVSGYLLQTRNMPRSGGLGFSMGFV